MAEFLIDTGRLAERISDGETVFSEMIENVDRLAESITPVISELRDSGDKVHAEKLIDLLHELNDVTGNMTGVMGYDRNAARLYEATDNRIADMISEVK